MISYMEKKICYKDTIWQYTLKLNLLCMLQIHVKKLSMVRENMSMVMSTTNQYPEIWQIEIQKIIFYGYDIAWFSLCIHTNFS